MYISVPKLSSTGNAQTYCKTSGSCGVVYSMILWNASMAFCRAFESLKTSLAVVRIAAILMLEKQIRQDRSWHVQIVLWPWMYRPRKFGIPVPTFGLDDPYLQRSYQEGLRSCISCLHKAITKKRMLEAFLFQGWEAGRSSLASTRESACLDVITLMSIHTTKRGFSSNN